MLFHNRLSLPSYACWPRAWPHLCSDLLNAVVLKVMGERQRPDQDDRFCAFSALSPAVLYRSGNPHVSRSSFVNSRNTQHSRA